MTVENFIYDKIVSSTIGSRFPSSGGRLNIGWGCEIIKRISGAKIDEFRLKEGAFNY